MKSKIKTYLLHDFDTNGMKSMAKNTDNPIELLNVLWGIVEENEYPFQWRAAWFFEQTIHHHPKFANLFYSKIIAFLPFFNHPGQLRHALKVILITDMALWDFGKMLNLGYDLMMSKDQPPAIRVNAMSIIYLIVLHEPDLKREFIESLQLINKEGGMGINSRAKKIMIDLSRNPK